MRPRGWKDRCACLKMPKSTLKRNKLKESYLLQGQCRNHICLPQKKLQPTKLRIYPRDLGAQRVCEAEALHFLIGNKRKKRGELPQ